jgi:short-subunit dehydrogenase
MSMTNSKIKGVALVTGASSGIGKAIALKVASIGYETYAAARRLDQMESLKSKGIHILHLDLTDETSIRNCVATIQEENGGVDVLVNNAGYGAYGSVEEIPLAEARRQFEVNFFGLAALTQLVIPHMRKKRSGRILNVSSVGGVSASPYGGYYHASKFAVEGFSSALRQELNPFDIDVVIIRPGAIKSGWRDLAGSSLLENSSRGPYSKAVQPMYAKFMGPDFDKLVADPAVIGEVVAKAVTAKRPQTVYTAPRLAKTIILINTLLGSDRLRDAFTRKFIGLPKTIK